MYSFRKNEKLCSQNKLDALIESGRRIHIAPISTIYSFTDASDKVSVQIAFSVPKRHHKKAVSRNLIKRQMREAYRLKKKDLSEACVGRKKNCSLLLVYNSSSLPDFQEVQSKIILTLDRLIKVLEQSH